MRNGAQGASIPTAPLSGGPGSLRARRGRGCQRELLGEVRRVATAATRVSAAERRGGNAQWDVRRAKGNDDALAVARELRNRRKCCLLWCGASSAEFERGQGSLYAGDELVVGNQGKATYTSRYASNTRSREVLRGDGNQGAGRVESKGMARWKLQVMVVAVSMLLCNLDRVAMGILAVPLLKEFNIGLTAMGVLQSSFLWGYLIGQLPAGIMADKYGGTRTMLGGLFLWSVCTVLTAFSKYSSSPLTVAIVSRVLMGLGSAVALPAVAATIAKEVPEGKRARCTTLSYALFNIGNVLANFCTPYVSESIGWQWSFVAYGFLGIVWAFAMIPVIRMKRSTGSVGDEPRDGVKSSPEGKDAGTGQTERTRISLRKLLSRRVLSQLAVLMYAHSTIGLGYFTLQSWIPTFFSNDIGITSLRTAGLLTAVVWLATSINTAFVGVVADKMRKTMPTWKVRRAAMTVSTLVPAICWLILSVCQNPSISVLCMLVGLVCWSFDYAGFHPYIIDVAGPYSGTVLSITNSAGIIAGIAGNIVTGYLVSRTGSFSVVFRGLAGVYIISCVLWNVFMRGQRLDIDKLEPAAA